jgi:hypothetical protein
VQGDRIDQEVRCSSEMRQKQPKSFSLERPVSCIEVPLCCAAYMGFDA